MSEEALGSYQGLSSYIIFFSLYNGGDFMTVYLVKERIIGPNDVSHGDASSYLMGWKGEMVFANREDAAHLAEQRITAIFADRKLDFLGDNIHTVLKRFEQQDLYVDIEWRDQWGNNYWVIYTVQKHEVVGS